MPEPRAERFRQPQAAPVTEDFDLGVFPGKCLDFFQRAVSRTIVDDNGLAIQATTLEYPDALLYDTSDVAFFVAGRHQDRNLGLPQRCCLIRQPNPSSSISYGESISSVRMLD